MLYFIIAAFGKINTVKVVSQLKYFPGIQIVTNNSDGESFRFQMKFDNLASF
jgi:hypothetical protein